MQKKPDWSAETSAVCGFSILPQPSHRKHFRWYNFLRKTVRSEIYTGFWHLEQGGGANRKADFFAVGWCCCSSALKFSPVVDDLTDEGMLVSKRRLVADTKEEDEEVEAEDGEREIEELVL